MPEIKINLEEAGRRLLSLWWVPLVVLFIVLAVQSRSGPLINSNLLGPDDYYFLRFAEVIDETGKIPTWDPLGFYPPGRRIDKPWFSFSIVVWDRIRSVFTSSTIMDATKTYFLPLTVLAGVIAFFFGKEMKNPWAGLFLCVLILFSHEMASKMYANTSDTGMWEMLGTILCTYLFYRMVDKKTISSGVIFGIGIGIFMLMWKGYWICFWITVPIIAMYFFIFTAKKWAVAKTEIIKSKKSNKRETKRISLKDASLEGFKHMKPLLVAWGISLGILMLFCLFNFQSFIPEFRPGYDSSIWDVFTRPYVQYKYFAVKEANGLPNVNVSVSELRTVDLKTVMAQNRLFLVLTSLSLLILLYNIIKGVEVSHDILVFSFVLSWLVVTLIASEMAVRFVFFLLFPLAIGGAYFFGYIAGKFSSYSGIFKRFCLSFIVVCLFYLMIIPYQQILAEGRTMGSVVSSNYYDGLLWLRDNAAPNSIVGSWWDPGHYVTEVTHLRSIADGAHCLDCSPYPHGQRLVDMGYCLSGSNETECINRLQKYRGDSPEFYWIDSSDLIYKYGWFSYFGGWDGNFPGPALNYYILPLDKQASGENRLVFRSSQSQVESVIIDYNDTSFSPYIYSSELNQVKGLRYIVIPYGGKLSITEAPKWDIDSLVFLSDDRSIAVLMMESVKDSLFTDRFFMGGYTIFGEPLKYFEVMYENPEMKIYRINFPEEIGNANI